MTGQIPHESEPDRWVITVEGGLAFWGNAVATLEHFSLGQQHGPIKATLTRLAAADADFVPASAGSQEPAPAERDERTWTLHGFKLGTGSEHVAFAAGPRVPHGGIVEVVPRSELARVQEQLDQAREALKKIDETGKRARENKDAGLHVSYAGQFAHCLDIARTILTAKGEGDVSP